MADEEKDRHSKSEKKMRKKKRRKRKRKARMSMHGLERMMRQLDSGTLLATVGSAPAFATAETMITASQAQGQMMMGAVANQQRLNALGLVATGECVMQMMNLGNTVLGDEEEEDEIDNDLLRRMMMSNPPVQ